MNAKIRVVRVLAGFVLALGFVEGAAAQTLKLPPHEKVVLKNGLTVLLMEKHGVPMIDVAAIVKAGSV
ncbi:MAG TPA: insulinase family protein, partial [Candidatus Angelobacter sp.]|nr:insulinase family protein [Candidatus Angelobacter sp.]